MKSSLDQKLDALRPGRTLKLGARAFAERSGDGKILRFVRITGNTWTVFKTCKF